MVVNSKAPEPELEILDRELDDLPAELQWREWMNRIEAILFASASPVLREDLARVVGQGANLDLLIEDIQAELKGKPFDADSCQAQVGWAIERVAG